MVFYNNNELIAAKINEVSQLTQPITQSEISKFINRITERIIQMEAIFVIDRFEGDYAICENRDTGEMIDIQLSELPKEVKEGNVLKYKNGKYIIDADSQKEIENRIADKMKKLWNN